MLYFRFSLLKCMKKTRIGVLGGGQLGRMLVEASIPWCLDVSILDESIEFPAAGICTRFYEGDFANYDDVLQFGLAVDVITVEIESVNVEALKQLKAQGKTIVPDPEVLEIINDKGIQKQFYRDHGFPTSEFSLFNDKAEILSAIENGQLSLPFVQKLRVGGYDGRGVNVIRTVDDLDLLFDEASVVEKMVDIQKELAVITARKRNGEMKTFPMVEMSFHPTANLVEFLFCPADVDQNFESQARALTEKIATALEVTGLLAVEFFMDQHGKLWVNEMAPRPHNSGHHTIEANITSQFEQHLRVLADLPLGETDLIMPAVMINLLGAEGHAGEALYQGIEEAMAKNGVYPHLYNKKMTKPKRKMGHITVTQHSLEDAKKCARELLDTVKVISSNKSIENGSHYNGL